MIWSSCSRNKLFTQNCEVYRGMLRFRRYQKIMKIETWEYDSDFHFKNLKISYFETFSIYIEFLNNNTMYGSNNWTIEQQLDKVREWTTNWTCSEQQLDNIRGQWKTTTGQWKTTTGEHQLDNEQQQHNVVKNNNKK